MSTNRKLGVAAAFLLGALYVLNYHDLSDH